MPSRPTNGGSTVKGMKRNRRYIAATIAALGTAAAFATSASAVTTATTIPLSPDARPEGITLGPDSAVYYTDFGGHAIVRTTSGPGQPFSVPNDGPNPPGVLVDVSGPAFITTGPDGALWFTAYNGTVGRMAAGGGQPVGFAVAGVTATANLRGIAAGATNTLWFAEAEGDKLRSVTTSGATGPQPAVDLSQATGLNLGTPEALVAGPGDGNIYFTTSLGTIGKKDTSNASAPVTTSVGVPANGITFGPDGKLYVTSGTAGPGQVSRVSTTPVVEQTFGLPVGAAPQGITTGADGALWVAESGINSVARVTTAGAVTQVPLTGCTTPRDIVKGADNALWVTCFGNNALVRITDVAAPPGTTPPGTTPPGTTPPIAALKGGFSFAKGKVFARKAFAVKVTFNKAVTKSRVRVQIKSVNTKARGAIKVFKTVSTKLVTGKKATLKVKIAKPGKYRLRITFVNGTRTVNAKAVKVTVKKKVIKKH